MFIARLYLCSAFDMMYGLGGLDRSVMWWIRRRYILYISIASVSRMAQSGIILLVITIIIVITVWIGLLI